MSGWMILLIVIGVLVLLAVAGAIAQRRRLEATTDSFAEHLDQTNRDLADAHAADKGWDRESLEQAARQAVADQRPDLRVDTVTLIQVEDRPGTEDDRAVLRVDVDGGARLDLTLARHGGEWIPAALET